MLKLLQIVTLLFTTVFFSIANAQTVDVQSEVQSFMQELSAKTTLTAEQKTSLEKIMTDSITQREAVISSHQGQKGLMVKKDIRDQLEPINDKTRSEVQNVLTPDQYNTFLDLQTARQEKLKERINNEF